MSDYYREVLDPQTTTDRLAEIGQLEPQLISQIVYHPNCTMELRQWLQSRYFGSAPLASGPARASVFSTDASATAPGPTATSTIGPTRRGNFDPHAGSISAPNGRGRPRFKKRVWIPVATVLVLSLVVVGGWFGFNRFFTGGAKSPEAAAEQFVDSSLSLDLVAIYKLLAPSERAVIEATIEVHDQSGGALEQNEERKTDVDEAAAEVGGVMTVGAADVQYSNNPLSEDIVEVEIDDAKIHVDGDRGAITHGLSNAVKVLWGAGADGQIDDNDAAGVDDSVESEVDRWKLPYRADLKGFLSDMGFGENWQPRLYAVKESGRWFISPGLTLRGMYQAADDEDTLSQYWDVRMQDAKSAPGAQSPGQAGNAFFDAYFSGDIFSVADHSTSSERRLLNSMDERFVKDNIGIPFFESLPSADVDMSDGTDFTRRGEVKRRTVEPARTSQFSAVGGKNAALVRPESVTVDWSEIGTIHEEYTVCEPDYYYYSYDDCNRSDEYAYSADMRLTMDADLCGVVDSDVRDDSGSDFLKNSSDFCIADALEGLDGQVDPETIGLVAVKEGKEWYISPTATWLNLLWRQMEVRTF